MSSLASMRSLASQMHAQLQAEMVMLAACPQDWAH